MKTVLMNTDREWAEAVKVFFWQEGGARNCQMEGVILSIRVSVRIRYSLLCTPQ